MQNNLSNAGKGLVDWGKEQKDNPGGQALENIGQSFTNITALAKNTTKVASEELPAKVVDTAGNLLGAAGDLAKAYGSIPSTAISTIKWVLIGGGVIAGGILIFWVVMATKGQAGGAIKDISTASVGVTGNAAKITADVSKLAMMA